MDMNFDFAWNAKTLPVIATLEGVSHQFELEGRVPVWPLCRARILECAGSEEAASPGPETEKPESVEKTESLDRRLLLSSTLPTSPSTRDAKCASKLS
jgi:hypothetical protein